MPRPFNITMPPPDDFYFVREEQLDFLAEPSKNRAFEVGLAALFGALGFGQNVWAVLKAVSNGTAISGWDTFGAAACIGLAFLAAAKFLQAKRSRDDTALLKERIKSGQKVVVG